MSVRLKPNIRKNSDHKTEDRVFCPTCAWPLIWNSAALRAAGEPSQEAVTVEAHCAGFKAHQWTIEIRTLPPGVITIALTKTKKE